MSVVLVGIHAYRAAAEALRWAAGYARRVEARLRVMPVWKMPPRLPRAELVAPQSRPDRQQAATDVPAEGSAGVRAVAGDAGAVDGEVRRGPTRAVLVDAVERADLLVVGNVGHGRLSEMPAGSAAEYCVRHASCPVAVIPPAGGVRKSAA